MGARLRTTKNVNQEPVELLKEYRSDVVYD